MDELTPVPLDELIKRAYGEEPTEDYNAVNPLEIEDAATVYEAE